jgi:hypothetical protein
MDAPSNSPDSPIFTTSDIMRTEAEFLAQAEIARVALAECRSVLHFKPAMVRVAMDALVEATVCSLIFIPNFRC